MEKEIKIIQKEIEELLSFLELKASIEELASNPRARSAILRVAEKLRNENEHSG